MLNKGMQRARLDHLRQGRYAVIAVCQFVS